MKTQNGVYKLYYPSSEYSANEYLIVIYKDGKRYGYLKTNGIVKKQHAPNTKGMHFVGYIKESVFNDMLFIDML